MTNVKISWRGIEDVGFQVFSDSWKSENGLVQYNKGFSASREVIVGEEAVTYIVICKILSDNLNKPLFECKVMKDNNQVGVFRAENPTTAMKSAFTSMRAKPKKRWNGNVFFGLKFKDVIATTLAAPQLNEDMPSAQCCALQAVANVGCYEPTAKVSWISMISIGIPNLNEHFKVNICKKIVLMQPGYEGIRAIQLNGNTHKIHCKIERSRDDTRPVFLCVCDEPRFTKSSESITKVVTMTFKELNYNPRRKWSGYEFFGIMAPERLNLLICPNVDKENMVPRLIKENSTPLVKKKINSPLVEKLLHNQHRNAGPTSGLCAKAQKERNEFIDEIVEFSSFGDVASKLLNDQGSP